MRRTRQPVVLRLQHVTIYWLAQLWCIHCRVIKIQTVTVGKVGETEKV